MVHHLFSFLNSPLFCLTRRKYISSSAYYFDGGCRQAGEMELRGLGLKFDEEGSLVTYVQNRRERIELDIYSPGRESTHCNMLNPIGRSVMVAYVRALSKGEFVVVVNDR